MAIYANERASRASRHENQDSLLQKTPNHSWSNLTRFRLIFDQLFGGKLSKWIFSPIEVDLFSSRGLGTHIAMYQVHLNSSDWGSDWDWVLVKFLQPWMGLKFKARPHYAEGIWKRSFFFLRLGLPSTLAVTKIELFENALQTGGIWKRRFLVFVWTENILKTELFENDDMTIITISLPEFFFSKHKSKMTRDCCVF